MTPSLRDSRAILMSSTWSVALHGKRYYTNVLTLSTLKWGDYPGLSGGVQSNDESPADL